MSSWGQGSADGQSDDRLEAPGIWRVGNETQPGVVEAVIKGVPWEETWPTEYGDRGEASPCKPH